MKPAYEHALTRLFATRTRGIKPGLDAMRAALALRGHPQDRPACSLHIAGTNGKGSTVAFAESVLGVAGYRVGAFTSPHLVDFRERFRIGGSVVSISRVTEVLEMVMPTIDSCSLTFFEASMLIAAELFAVDCDVAIWETGLGGRLDATNTVCPDVCVITSIALDHQAYLGNTVEEIAKEKAGIFKSGVDVIVAEGLPARALQVVRESADEASVASLRIARPDEVLGPDLALGLPGKHQRQNAACAVLALEALQRRGLVTMDASAIPTGLGQTRLAGRLDAQQWHGCPLLIDGAHNLAAAHALVTAVPAQYVLVFAVSEDKDYRGMLALLLPNASACVVTSTHDVRALPPEALLAVVRSVDPTMNVHSATTVEVAVDRAAALATVDVPVLVCGSLFLAGEVYKLLS